MRRYDIKKCEATKVEQKLGVKRLKVYKTDILNQGKRTLFSIDVIIRDHKPFLLEHLSEKAVSNKQS